MTVYNIAARDCSDRAVTLLHNHVDRHDLTEQLSVALRDACTALEHGGAIRISIVYPPDVDTESSASRQHFIDTGRYLTLAEIAEINGG